MKRYGGKDTERRGTINKTYRKTKLGTAWEMLLLTLSSTAQVRLDLGYFEGF
jgi:hypothetical protein